MNKHLARVMTEEKGKLPLTKRLCLTCKKPYRSWFAAPPIKAAECAKCYIERTTPKRRRKNVSP